MRYALIKDGLSVDQLKAALEYFPDSGLFFWRYRPELAKRINTRLAGNVAGCRCKRHNYVLINLNQRLYKAHRLAWLYTTGEWPDGVIDHIDGDGLNNRIENLRVATLSENNMNRRATSRNTSGFKGASWSKTNKQWLAHISFGGKAYHLGFFATVEEAHAAYRGASVIAHGAFARTE